MEIDAGITLHFSCIYFYLFLLCELKLEEICLDNNKEINYNYGVVLIIVLKGVGVMNQMNNNQIENVMSSIIKTDFDMNLDWCEWGASEHYYNIVYAIKLYFNYLENKYGFNDEKKIEEIIEAVEEGIGVEIEDEYNFKIYLLNEKIKEQEEIIRNLLLETKSYFR